MAHEEGCYRSLAAFELRYLRGVGGDDFVNQAFEKCGVGDLLRLVAVGDKGEGAGLSGGGVEELLELLAADGVGLGEVRGEDEAVERDGALVERDLGGAE